MLADASPSAFASLRAENAELRAAVLVLRAEVARAWS